MGEVICLINGKPGSSISIADRALQYGDGLFETIRIRDGVAEYLPRHLARLRQGQERLKFAGLDFGLLAGEIESLAGLRSDAVLKVILSRGAGGRGYRPDPGLRPNRLLSLHELPRREQDYGLSGIQVRTCTTRLALQPALAGIKHLNCLQQVLARGEWSDSTIQEGLMLDTTGRVIEGTMSNLFLVRDGALLTADLSDCGVAGIVRSVLMDIALGRGIEVRKKSLYLDDLHRAEEMFVCNSLIGVWPVRRLDEDRVYQIGPLTSSLADALREWDDTGNETWYST